MRIAASHTTREPSPFIGRAQERGSLLDALLDGAKLITLTGPSGIGKTQLAKQVAAEFVASLPRGGESWFCSLTDCRDVAAFEAAVAHTLEMPRQQGADLARAIANRGRVLLILDHVNSIAPRIREVLERWLDRCVELQIVVTSLIPLGLEGEVQVRLGPLEVDDAVALYLERAHRAWANRGLMENDEVAIPQLVRRLDRNPLAIELAAALVRVLPPRVLVSKLEQRFELLGDCSQESSRSLAGALDLTWEFLEDSERAVLARASVFEAGFTYEAAKAILEDPSCEAVPDVSNLAAKATAANLLELLHGLQSKALLFIDEAPPQRFQLFESVKEYAQLQLRGIGAWEECIRRHAAYYVEKGELYAKEADGRRIVAALQWLKTERANLLAVHRRFRQADPSLSVRAGLALDSLLLSAPRSSAEAHLSESILEAARRSPHPIELILALEFRAKVLDLEGRLEEVRICLDEALSLARDPGARQEEAQLLVRSGLLHLRRDEAEAALPLLESANLISREINAPNVEAYSLLALGEEALARLSLEEAETEISRSLELFRKIGQIKGERKSTRALCWVWASQGRLSEANQALLGLLELTRETGDRINEANALRDLGVLTSALGDEDQSEAYFLQSLAIDRELGNDFHEGITLANLGMISLARGDLKGAESRFVHGERIFLEYDSKSRHAQLRIYIAVMEARLGQTAEARRTLDEGRRYFQALNNRVRLIEVDIAEGLLEVAEARSLALMDVAAAEARVEHARARLASIPPAEARAARSLFPAMRLLEQELVEWEADLPEVKQPASRPGLLVGSNADWFERSGHPRVPLRRRIAIHRIFAALVKMRLDSPGAAIDPHELFEVGWPNVQLHPDTAIKRLYFGIWSLRELGLSGILLNQADGYLLDPKTALELEEE